MWLFCVQINSTSHEQQITGTEEAAGGEAAPETQLEEPGEPGEGDLLTLWPPLQYSPVSASFLYYPVVLLLL